MNNLITTHPVEALRPRLPLSESAGPRTTTRATDDVPARYMVWFARDYVPVSRRRRYRSHAERSLLSHAQEPGRVMISLADHAPARGGLSFASAGGARL